MKQFKLIANTFTEKTTAKINTSKSQKNILKAILYKQIERTISADQNFPLNQINNHYLLLNESL